MAMSSFRGKGVIAYINVTPLVDVLLVLLVIFMVTAPMVSQKVKMDLPQASAELPVQSSPQKPIHLKIDQNGQIYWNGVPLGNL